MINDGDFGFVVWMLEEFLIIGFIGVYLIDIDFDGIIDFVILCVGEDVIFKGQGDCCFVFFENIGFFLFDYWIIVFLVIWEGDNILLMLVFGIYVDCIDFKGLFEICDVSLFYCLDGGCYGDLIKLEFGFCMFLLFFIDWVCIDCVDLWVSNDCYYYVKGG